MRGKKDSVVENKIYGSMTEYIKDALNTGRGMGLI